MTATTTVRLSQRQALCGARVTLDGQPARISGSHLPFAKVISSRTGLWGEWAWETVARIVANGGEFRS